MYQFPKCACSDFLQALQFYWKGCFLCDEYPLNLKLRPSRNSELYPIVSTLANKALIKVSDLLLSQENVECVKFLRFSCEYNVVTSYVFASAICEILRKIFLTKNQVGLFGCILCGSILANLVRMHKTKLKN